MSKPIANVKITSLEDRSAEASAVFDSGSFYTIIRENKVPEGATITLRATPREFNTAASGGSLKVTGEMPMIISIGDKMITDSVLVSPNLAQEMLIGAGTMQKWDIRI